MAYKLTAKGESRALRTDGANTAEDAVLILMYEQKDALELEEIAGEAHLTPEVAERVLNRLSMNQYLKEV